MKFNEAELNEAIHTGDYTNMKYITIERCDECTGSKRIKDISKIPKWCPLPDYPKNVTEYLGGKV